MYLHIFKNNRIPSAVSVNSDKNDNVIFTIKHCPKHSARNNKE